MQKFEKGFFVGAATAAHQVEGNNIHSDYWHKSSCLTPALLSRAALPVTIIIGMRKIFDCWRMPG